MLITSDKCRLCDEIRSKFVTSKAVDKLSKQFVLVNAVDEETLWRSQSPWETVKWREGDAPPRGGGQWR